MPEKPVPPMGEIVLYQTEDGRTRLECRFADETLWLSQALIAELFQIALPTVNGHLKTIYDEGELAPGPTIRNFRIVRREGLREVVQEASPRGRQLVSNAYKFGGKLWIGAGQHAPYQVSFPSKG